MKTYAFEVIVQRLLRSFAIVICPLIAVCGADAGVVGRDHDVEPRLDYDAMVLRKADYTRWAKPQLDSLEALSIHSLRSRRYQSSLTIEAQLGSSGSKSTYDEYFSRDGSAAYRSYIASYDSDGLRVFTRLDVPASPPPPRGFPVIIFVHGWVGEKAAPDWNFAYSPDSGMAEVIDGYVDAGFVVLTPGLRGHGKVDGVAAEGIEFLAAWDNPSYLSPMFYAIDVLNLLEGVQSLERVSWRNKNYQHRLSVPVNRDRINIAGHSQGGDVVLSVLAIAGEGSQVETQIFAGSIWSGCFAPRTEQASVYRPMQETVQSFMSGDGSWNGTAVGADGEINADFVFGYPPDWIDTVDPNSREWTWQADIWRVATVEDALRNTFDEMYRRLREGVADIADKQYRLIKNQAGRLMVAHDEVVERALRKIGGFYYEQYLSEPLNLHYSDRDFYSLPKWNADLAKRINLGGGTAREFVYPGTTHGLSVSRHQWFSPPGTERGIDAMIARDVILFNGGNPEDTSFP